MRTICMRSWSTTHGVLLRQYMPTWSQLYSLPQLALAKRLGGGHLCTGTCGRGLRQDVIKSYLCPSIYKDYYSCIYCTRIYKEISG